MGNAGSHNKLTNKPEDQDGAENETNVKIETTGSGDENVADAKEEVETPVLLKNRHHIMALVDPRSPTQEISRTPIALDEQQGGQGQRLNPRLAKLKEGSTPVSGGNTSLSAGFFDPRSPAQEFDRTPIRYSKRDGVATTKITF